MVLFQFLSISDAVYNMDWVGTSISFQKDLLFNIMRLQRPVYLTMGKFAPKNLNIYVGVALIHYQLELSSTITVIFLDYENIVFILHTVIENLII